MARNTKKEVEKEVAEAPTDSPTANCSLKPEPQPKRIEVGEVEPAKAEPAPEVTVTKGDDGIINIA